MANRNITLKRNNAGTTEELYPTTDWAQINNKPGTFAPTGHTHGNINDDGQISASAPIASGDHLVIADNSSNNDLTTSSITFGTGTTTFLRNDGTWGTPSGADGNNYLTGVSGSGDGTVTFTRQGLSNLTWDASHSHSEYLLTTAKAADSNLLDGIDSTNFKNNTHTTHSASNLAIGWYTIATVPGNRGIARFGLRDTASSRHQSVIFYAAHHYGTDASNTITVLHQSSFGTTPFRYIRIKEGGTYDGAALQVYIDGAGASVNVYMLGDNFQSSGWTLKDWIADATDPGNVSNYSSFVERGKIDLDNISQGGMATTGDIYAGGDTTQYRVLTTNDEGSGNGLDADTVDSLHASQFVRSDADDTMSGVLTLGPNSTWSKYLKIGGNANHSDANTGSIGVTNGNLHLDAATSNITYLNYYDGTGGVTFGNGAGTVVAWMGPDGDLWKGSADNTGSKYWHAGNDGAGSGLAADTLDGQHGSYYAPLASPALTGTPTAPTPAAGDDDTSIATTAFVTTAIDNLVNGASASFDTLKEIQDAMATDTELSNAINNLTIGNGSQTITAGTGLSGGGVFYANQVGNTAVTISHADTSSQASLTALTGANVISDIDVDGYGHITSMSTRALTAANIGAASTSHTHSNYVATAGDTMTGDLVLDHDGTGTAADSHALRFTARAANTDFSREIKLEDGGGFAFDSNILLTGDVTTNNAARTIDFTGFDKEGTTDFSDRAYIQHTTNTGGHSGSVLVISSQNDSSDGIAFQTNASSRLKHNSNNIFTDAYHPNADKWTTARTLTLSGDVTGSVSWDGSGNATMTTTVADDSHDLTWANIDGETANSVNGWGGLRHQTNDGYIDFGPANTSHAHIYTDRPSFYFNKNLLVNGTTLTGNTGTVTSVATGGGLTGGTITGSGTISHADTSSQASLTALTGANVVSDIDVDTYGHITGLATRALTPANIGAASSSHNHAASEIVTGELNTARLGSGTATSGYVLKSDGDGTASWQQDNNTTYSLGSFGVTATAAELNKMDGVTATTTELNYTDGVTSNIQTQLNGKLSTSAAAAAVTYVTSCPTSTNSTGMKVYVGSTDCSTKYTGWLYIIT